MEGREGWERGAGKMEGMMGRVSPADAEGEPGWWAGGRRRCGKARAEADTERVW